MEDRALRGEDWLTAFSLPQISLLYFRRWLTQIYAVFFTTELTAFLSAGSPT